MTIENFIQERVYLKGVSPRTVEWYHGAFRAFNKALESKQTIMARVAELKARGVSHITINSRLRCINAYFRRLHQEHGREFVRIPKLKEEQKVIQILGDGVIARILAFRPKSASLNLVRAHLVTLTMLDTALRILEVLGLTTGDVDPAGAWKGREASAGTVLPRVEEGAVSAHEISKTHLVFGTKNETPVTVVNIGRELGFSEGGSASRASGSSPTPCVTRLQCRF